MHQVDPSLLHDIRSYLLLRLGPSAEADRCLERLLGAATQLPAGLTAADARLRWFQRARRVSIGYAEPTPEMLLDLPWTPLPAADAEAAATELRRTLSPDARELLALKFTFGFVEPEMAAIVGESREHVEGALGVAIQHARTALGAVSAKLGPWMGAALRVDPDHLRHTVDQPIAAIGEVIDGRYLLEALLGRGASAQVFLASDQQIQGHRVALKLMREPMSDSSVAAILQHELEILASVWHPSVVQLKATGMHRGRIYLTMPFLQGETLSSRLARQPEGLGRGEAQRIFVALAGALSALHSAGIRHQDVNPQNIWLTQISGRGEELPLLLDLGVAARQDEFLPAGTPSYMAPEVALNFLAVNASGGACEQVSEKADIYSLAISLVEALAPDVFARLGGAHDSNDDRFAHRAAGVLPPWTDGRLRDLAPHLDRWMALDPDKRPDADTFARELSALTAREVRQARRMWLAQRVLLPAALVIAGVTSVAHRAFEKHTRSLEYQQTVLNNMAADGTELRGALRGCVDAEAELQSQLGELRTQRNTCETQRSQFQAGLGRESQARRTCERALSHEEGDGRHCRTDLDDSERGRRTCEEQRTQLQANLATSQQQATAMEGQFQRCTGELQGARTEASTCGASLTEAQGTLGTCSTEREQRAQQVSACTEQLASARHEHDECATGLARAREQLASRPAEPRHRDGAAAPDEPEAPTGGSVAGGAAGAGTAAPNPAS